MLRNLFGHNKEQQIIELFSRGDALAMDRLYAEYADHSALVCSRYIRNEEDRHDVLQESFIKIFTKIDTFEYRGKGSLKAWVTRLVINEALTFLRKGHPAMFVDREGNLPDLPDLPDDEPDAEGLSIGQITDLILQLPPGYRTVFNLLVIEGKSHKEAAETLGIKPDTVASQFHKAKKMLARMINKQQRLEQQR